MAIFSTNMNYLPIVNKARRPKFDVHLKASDVPGSSKDRQPLEASIFLFLPHTANASQIYDLNNVPLVQGVSLIKWYLPHSIHGEHRGRTPKCPIANHRVEYAYSKIIPVRIAIDKNNNLSECFIEFEVSQEFNSPAGNIGRDEKIILGKVTLNLSEYVEESEAVMRETGFWTRGSGFGGGGNAGSLGVGSIAGGGGGSGGGVGTGGTAAAQGRARSRSSLSAHTPITPSDNVSPTTIPPSNNSKDANANNKAPSVNEPAPEQEVAEGVIRRYLMQDSKINSTLKVGILMVQVDGERNFVAPALKTAPGVFGGIGGMVGNEQNNNAATALASSSSDPTSAEFGQHLLQDKPQDGGGAQFSLSSSGKSRDVYELQDMYRRALAASWACQPGELPADECIEDIFAGGDGFGPDGPVGFCSPTPGDATPKPGHGHRGSHHGSSHHRSSSRSRGRSGLGRQDSGSTSGGGEDFLRPGDGGARRGLGGRRNHARHGSGESTNMLTGRHGAAGGRSGNNAAAHDHHDRRGGGHRRDGSKDSTSLGEMRSRNESVTSLAATIDSERGRSGFKSPIEVNEFEVRDDLVAWRLPGTVS